MTLVEFLLARLAEDEAAAKDWQANYSPQYPTLGDPVRILAECEAKRRIVKRCSSVGALRPSEHLAQGVLSLLALPYADHEDYDEGWRP